MSDTKTDWPSDLILEFIELYKEHRVLWDPEDPDRKNRDKHHEAWKGVQSKLSTRIDIHELKRKKESLLASYRMLRRKSLASRKNSDDGVGTYQPSWFAYQSLDEFLNKNLHSSHSNPSKSIPRTPLKRAAAERAAEKCNYSSDDSENDKDAEAVDANESPEAKVPATTENMTYFTSSKNIRLREPQIFGQSVGLQLCEVEKNQRIIAERVISEVLFHARLGNLTESSTVIVSQYADLEDAGDETLHDG